MSIDRETNGDITFYCDRCSNYIETEETDFAFAIQKAREEDWRSVRTFAGGWDNLCPECKEKDDNDPGDFA